MRKMASTGVPKVQFRRCQLRLSLRPLRPLRPPTLPLGEFQPFEFNPVAADLGKVVLGLLHKPAIFGAAKHLR